MNKLGDIFWDLAPLIYYTKDHDIGCTIYVANHTDEKKERACIFDKPIKKVIVS